MHRHGNACFAVWVNRPCFMLRRDHLQVIIGRRGFGGLSKIVGSPRRDVNHPAIQVRDMTQSTRWSSSHSSFSWKRRGRQLMYEPCIFFLLHFVAICQQARPGDSAHSNAKLWKQDASRMPARCQQDARLSRLRSFPPPGPLLQKMHSLAAYYMPGVLVVGLYPRRVASDS